MAHEARVRRFVSRSPAATEALGAALGAAIEGGSIVALEGDLGAGKTCFVRGLARGLAVADAVTSPTYALMQSYVGRLELFHFDAWMEGRERSFLLDGGLECLHANSVAAIEWADRVLDLLPPRRLRVRCAHAGAEARSIEIAVEADGSAARMLATLALPDGIDEID